MFEVEPFGYSTVSTEPVLKRYYDGNYRLELHTLEGEPMCVATVNIPDVPLPTSNHVWIKNYSENEGVLKALENAGICKYERITTPLGFVEAHLVELTPEFLIEYDGAG